MRPNKGARETNNLLRLAAAFFELDEIKDVQKAGGHANENYLVTTTKGEFLFKVLLEHSPEEFLTEVKYLERLKKYDFPAPSYIKSPTDSYLYKHNRQSVAALPKLDGKHPEPSKAVNESIGYYLARLHQIPITSIPPRSHWLDESYLSKTVPLIKKYFPKESGRVIKVFASLEGFNSTSLPQSIIHGDISPHNTLYKSNTLVAFLDWEEVGVGASLLDLATGILNFALWGERFNPEFYKSLLSGYQKVRPLKSVEMDNMVKAIEYTGLTLSVWWLLHYGFYHPDSEKKPLYDYYWRLGLDKLKF